MQEAIQAATLDRAEEGGERIWHYVAMVRYGGYQRDRTLYEAIERDHLNLLTAYRIDNQEFVKAYQAIFGDRHRIPSYGHFRKLVCLGRNQVLVNPSNWPKLPDSFEAIYQLSFCVRKDVLTAVVDFSPIQQLLDSGSVTKRTNMAEIEAIRKTFNEDRELQTQRGLHGDDLNFLETDISRKVIAEMFRDFVTNEQTKTRLTREVAKRKKAFLKEHPKIDEYFTNKLSE